MRETFDSDEIQVSQDEWFAFRVRPKHEKVVSHSLRHKGIREFLPLTRESRRWANRTRYSELVLFPGYVFCSLSRSSMLPVLSTYGVVDVVRAGRFPLAADPEEIEALRIAVAAGAPIERCDYIHPGNKVEITDGPLAGLQGVLMEVRSSRRLVLSVSLLRRSVLVEIDRDRVVHCRECMPDLAQTVPQAH
jgi:transcription antitermination factor NusG